MPETSELQQALAATAAPATDSNPQGPAGAATSVQAPQDGDNLPASIKEYLEKNPDHKPVADLVMAEMNRGFTPKLQEAAELRKMTEGIDPQVIQAVKYLYTLSPNEQAETLRQWANSLTPAQQAQVQAAVDQPQQPEFYDDASRQTWERLQVVEKRIQKQELQAFSQHINAEMDRLQGELGLKIPIEARAAAGELARRAGIPVADAYFAINRETLLKSASDRARQEAAAIVQEKVGQAAGNPAGVANRAPERPSSEGPRSFKDIYAAEKEAAGL